MSESYFIGTDELVEALESSDPDDAHLTPVDPDQPTTRGKPLSGSRTKWWSDSSYVIEVDADKILFMEGNQWRFEHAAGIYMAMRHGEVFEVPAARIRRITAADVKQTARYAKNGELAYQMNMSRQWERSDVGSYTAQLLDGNHRALAALALHERAIPVYVGENYRGEVRKKDWLKG